MAATAAPKPTVMSCSLLPRYTRPKEPKAFLQDFQVGHQRRVLWLQAIQKDAGA